MKVEAKRGEISEITISLTPKEARDIYYELYDYTNPDDASYELEQAIGAAFGSDL